MKKLYLFAAFCLLPFLTMAQNYIVGAGVGPHYGGMGVRVTTLDSWIGFTGGIGYSNGAPLSLGIIGEGTDNESLNSSTVKGLGFSVGFVGYLNEKSYLGLQLVGLGNYHQKVTEYNVFGNSTTQYEKAGYVYCVNWTMYGFFVPIGDTDVVFDFALNGALGGGAGKFAGYFGVTVGLGLKL